MIRRASNRPLLLRRRNGKEIYMATLKVIDVSYHNGTIDWEKVKAAGINGAILRCGYGMDQTDQDDKQYRRNADECTRLGIPFGIYLYSYADSIEKSKSEAQHALRLAKGYKLSYPIYYDLEQAGTESGAIERARVFCEAIEAAGYWAGIYANKHWWDNYLTGLTEYTRWIARYNNTLGMDNVDMWQYTSDGSVAGISGRVDLNHCYRDFPAEIGGAGSGGTGGSTQTTPTGSTLDLVVGVMQGKYGNGDARKTALGSRYDEAQDMINHISTASASTLASEVKSGKYGNGETRKVALGNRYDEVQDIVNQKSGTSYYPAFANVSIVDGLNSIGVDSSKEHRKKIAAANGIPNYRGTSAQNNQLCALAKKGRLKKA